MISDPRLFAHTTRFDAGYVRVKRFELSIRAAHRQGGSQYTPEEATRVNTLRQNIEEVFGISIAAEERAQREEDIKEIAALADVEDLRKIRDVLGVKRGDLAVSFLSRLLAPW